MKKMTIYEPAMCCETGICGIGVDSELLRISTVINNLKKQGIEINRYNLNNAPNEFVINQTINTMLMNDGVDILPVTIINNEVVKTKSYPSNQEIASFLDIPITMIGQKRTVKKIKMPIKSSCDCNGKDGCC